MHPMVQSVVSLQMRRREFILLGGVAAIWPLDNCGGKAVE
jgi:hypothetical protein